MKGSRFSEEQIIGVLREQEAGARTEEVCQRHGISSATVQPGARYRAPGQALAGRPDDSEMDRGRGARSRASLQQDCRLSSAAGACRGAARL